MTATHESGDLASMSAIELSEALQSRNVDATCEVCHHDAGWLFDSGQVDGNFPAVISVDKSTGLAKSTYMTVVVMTCKHCGNLRLFAGMMLQGSKGKTTNSQVLSDDRSE